MLTKIKFNLLHPTLNAMQQQAAYQLSEIEGWHVEGKTAFKDGLTPPTVFLLFIRGRCYRVLVPLFPSPSLLLSSPCPCSRLGYAELMIDFEGFLKFEGVFEGFFEGFFSIFSNGFFIENHGFLWIIHKNPCELGS